MSRFVRDNRRFSEVIRVTRAIRVSRTYSDY
jgi:hypothetical protein